MRVAVSPYHLTTREPAATAALLLGSSVVTMLPSPGAGDGGEEGQGHGRAHCRSLAEAAALSVPRYLDFMQSWRWSVPLWNAGVIGAACRGEEIARDVRTVCDQIAADDRLRSLRAFTRPELLESGERYLDAVARDVLKGGPDPGICVPVAAGVDRFAGRHGLFVFRSDPSSIAQKAEARMGQKVFSVAIPVLLQASAERYLLARDLLEPQLDDLRAAMTGLADLALAGETNGHVAPAQIALQKASRAYAAAFEDLRPQLTSGPRSDDEDDIRIIDGTVIITGMLMPSDAALTSSIAAMRALSPALAASPANPRNLPATTHQPDQPFITVMVRVLGKR
jgi:hypothetical protein